MKRVNQLKVAIIPVGITLTLVSFAIILIAPAAMGGDIKKSSSMSKSRSNHYVVERKILPDAPPEAGVKLLIGILRRIGNTPQIAMQQAQQNRIRAELNQSNKLFNQNATDPALAIRPREYSSPPIHKKKLASARYKSKSKLLASMPKTSFGKSVYKMGDNRYAGRSISKDGFQSIGPSGGDRSGVSSGYSRSRPSSHSTVRTYGRMSKQSEQRIKKSAEKLYNLSTALSNLQRRDTNSYVAKQQKKNRQIISASNKVSAGASNGLLIAKAPKIMEYSKQEGASLDKDRGFSPSSADRGFNYSPMDDESFEEAKKQLDQPAYYKHLKEYGKLGQDKNSMPPPAEKEFSDNVKKDSIYRSTFGRRNSPVHLAYMPPNLFSGVPGLRLGASKANVQSFMVRHGIIEKSSFNEWDVWVLKNKKTSRTSLQVYMRNGIVEAFRIFDSQFVPARIKVSLDTNLETMKEKFGEPAFILNEPSTNKKSSIRGVKNYVYPISQVSFQLARSNTKDKSIKIQSMFLFKFL